MSNKPKTIPAVTDPEQVPDPTGPIETPAVVPYVSLDELQASAVKVADKDGNLFYLEAVRGVYLLRPLPKAG